MKKIYTTNEAGECNLITVSSAASPETAHETITAETGGSCLGPSDDCEIELQELAARWSELEEMSEEEAAERITHLAEEWDLSAADLEYLF